MIILLFAMCGCGTEETTTPLFKSDSEDWLIGGDADWSFVRNEIVGKSDSLGGFMMTKVEFDNFRLELEFHPDSTVNSGVFVRCSERVLSAEDCYEINIWDLHPNQEWRTGAIVLRESPEVLVNTLNKWNTYKIECEDNRIRAWVNGQLTVDLVDESLVKGFIALQAAGKGTIRFRNVQLQQL